MPPPASSPAPQAPRRLPVRLHNWIGDVVVGVPALGLLASHGVEPVLLGKGWARSLLAGHGWTVHALEKGLRARGRQWRRIAADLGARRDGGPDALLLSTSFSSALECRLGGMRPMGYDTDLRGALLARSVPRPHGVHALDRKSVV